MNYQDIKYSLWLDYCLCCRLHVSLVTLNHLAWIHASGRIKVLSEVDYTIMVASCHSECCVLSESERPRPVAPLYVMVCPINQRICVQ